MYRIAVDGEDDEARGRSFGLELAYRVQTGHLRHRDIGHDDIGTEAARVLHQFPAVAHLSHEIGGVREKLTYCLAKRRMIVRQEDPQASRCIPRRIATKRQKSIFLPDV